NRNALRRNCAAVPRRRPLRALPEGMRILVTGGARGVGGESARYFAQQGANIVTFDVRDDLGAQLAKEATDAGPGKITFRHMDVSKIDEVRARVEVDVGELVGVEAVAA